EAGRAVNGGGFRAGLRPALLLATSALASPLLAFAARADTSLARKAAAPVSTVEVMQLAMFVGVMGAALVSAIFLIRERARTAAQNAQLRTRIADVNAALQRSEALLNLRDQRLIVWATDNKK
ncbi:alkaline phosphatase, partial [Mesorhizobium sp. M8A.F.Ca.ET.198.01.1.1]